MDGNRIALMALAVLSTLAFSVTDAGAQKTTRFADMSKSTIELPLKKSLAPSVDYLMTPAMSGLKTTPSRTASGPSQKFINPKVAPGAVQWHDSFEKACAASQLSGKPVLLFQMMGRLDDRFC